jgi:hypothetical protein
MSNLTQRKAEDERPGSPPAPQVAVPRPTENKPAAPDYRLPRVAVIGVHGVAHHDPGATANAMADLLLSIPAKDRDAPRYYDSFRSVGIHVPLQRLSVKPLAKVQRPTKFAQAFSFLQETSADFAYAGAQHARDQKAAGQSVSRGATGLAYMRQLLQGYKGGADGNVYITTRLEGNRTRSAPEGPAEVHIYEVLWADLARPTNTLLSFFFSLFQLLFHLGSLSRLAIDTGAAENPDLTWMALRKVQRYAVRMLVLPIPFLKLILLIALFSCLPALSQSTHDRIWFPLMIGAVAGLAMMFLMNRRGTANVKISPSLWAVRAIFPVAVGIVVPGVLLARHWVAPDGLSAFECWLVLGLALLFYILDKYKRNVHKAAEPIGRLLFGVCFFTFSGYLILSKGSVPQATVWTTEWTVAALRLSWMFLFGFAFVALVLGSVAWRSIPKDQPGRRARGRAAVRTTRFALALPSILFLLVTTILWAGLFSVARAVHDPIMEERYLTAAPGGKWLIEYHLVPDPSITRASTQSICNPSDNPSCLKTNLARIKELSDRVYIEPMPGKDADGRLSQIVPVPDSNWRNARPDYLEDILVWSAGSGFVLTLGLFALALFVLFWWALPSVFAEQYRLRDDKKPSRFTTNAVSLRMGTWLSRGLDATSVITCLFWCAIFLVPPLLLPGVAPWIASQILGHTANRISDVLGSGTEITRWVVKSFAVGATAAALAVAVKYGSPVLGAILDVDNYLRSLPDDATPRATISERYVSLLRYIARYRGPDGRGYDSVVIVAHSLGSVISADLLRFLVAGGDPELAAMGLDGTNGKGRISMKLLTMGNPTRQLLNRFFPYLYDWVRDEPDNGLHPLPDAALEPPTIGEGALPDPGQLGLERWTNVYRSGDYVGRSLWLDEWYSRTDGIAGSGNYSELIYVAGAGSRNEACIGAGAHTRYWDDTAPDVADLLNALIE